MDDTAIRSEDVMNDLGILVSSNLKWHNHIDKMIRKANQRLWLIIRTLGYDAPMKAKKMAYISMVRSIVEYGSVVWSPGDKDSIAAIENVQRMATNFICCNPHRTQPGYINYHARLAQCNLMPLSYRREINDIIFFCRAYNNEIAYDVTDHVDFINRTTGAATRQRTQALVLSVPKTKTTSSAHFYPTRMARLWNSFPQQLRQILKPLTSSLVIKQHIIPLYKTELSTLFNPDNVCTWIHTCRCNKCKVV